MNVLEKVKPVVKTAYEVAKPHIPHALTATGGVLSVTGAAMAVKETLKPEREEILNEHSQKMSERTDISIPATAKIYAKTSGKLALNYKGTIACEALALACVGASYAILHRSNAILAAELGGALAAISMYRERVQNEVGEEREAELYYGLSNKREVVSTYQNENESGETVEETVTSTVYDNTGLGLSPFAFIFDETNQHYHKSRQMSRAAIDAIEKLLTKKMEDNGWIVVNDIADMFKLPRSAQGALYAIYPKKYGGKSDNFKFKIIDLDSSENRYSCILDFEPDGLVQNNVDRIIKMKSAEYNAI